MGWPKPSHSCQVALSSSLEVELHSQFNDAIALLRRDGSKVRTAIGEATRLRSA